MAYYRDLAPCDFFGSPADGRLQAVGWLSPDYDYTRGPVEPAFFAKLAELLVDPWQPATTAGRHSCEFCRFTGGPAVLTYGETRIHLGVSNLFVPGEGCVYAAPSLVAHYVDAHGYAPPAEFRDALLRCPEMRSVAYMRALLRNGGQFLHRSPPG